MSAKATATVPTGRKKLAQGKECNATGVHDSQNTSSPEGNALPIGWEWKSVGEMVNEMQYGTSAKTSEDATGVPVLRMGNIKDGSLVLDSLKYLPKDHDEFPALLLQAGDLLFNRTNSADLVGKSAVYRGNPSPCSCASYLIRARLRPGYVPEYLAYYINSTFGRTWVSSVVSQQVGQANVNGTKLKALSLPVPGFPEQRRIMAEIDKQFTRLEAGVAALGRVQANLKRYRAAVLKAACEGRLVPTELELHRKLKTKNSKFETGAQLLACILTERRQNWQGHGRYKEPAALDTANLSPLPGGWKWATLDQLLLNITDGDHQPPPKTESGIPLLVIGDVSSGKLDFNDTRFVSREYTDSLDDFRKPKAGDVLYTLVGSYGIGVLVDTDREFCIQRHIAILRPHNASPSRFLAHILNSPAVFRQATAAATGTAQKTVPLAGLRRILIPLPPLAEQTRIVAEVERRLSVVEELESVVTANLQRATRLRQSILQNAFTGQL